ncbi:MAG TPA: trypco2 family protein, partial [Acidimicrobiales bacterium]|nr:trypco2 family protein [Acidimicrobiales bacterium]
MATDRQGVSSQKDRADQAGQADRADRAGQAGQAGQAGLPELADVIAAVRRELSRAQQEGTGGDIRFRVGPVELEFETTLSYTGGGEAGVRLYVLTLGAKGEISSVAAHRVKVVLQPVDPVTGQDAQVAAD